ncbi:DUF751 family protein [Chroogloeocystis siderophila]|jgi:membrane protein insertase Oxa1/YidC/SpoIIIJ|uniref:DUF751 domain-containing protein n=1 Tax=Chroogloeocystis siderophila 5.2 s.c.1 TaxID=247279 RepID=A0A1U7HZI2_9CHRO|nr:DUF751 family protein [Chroogloeocystis siderophila]OKH29072.1 hypothetical protein NIES1031_00225 [Chroogloeocystis siderophila 5.2 s.c.1]
MFDGFWQNISRYPRYFISIVLGIFLNAFAPLAPLFKRPVSAIALISVFIGLIVFVTFTLRAMLGIDPI